MTHDATPEIIGILPHRFYSEVYAHPLSEFDTDLIRDCAQAHEAAGYDRVLIANSATYPDSMPIAAWVAAHTTKLKMMIAHRPGFVAPTMTARMLATIDRLSGGRAGVHIITGSSDHEMESDGDFLTKEVRYERSREYVAVMKRIWASEEPFDHAGPFYRFNRGFAAVKPVQRPGLTVFWGGSSDKALEMGAEVADVYALGGGPVPKIRELIGRARALAARHGRTLEFLLSIRVVLGDTEDQAWANAHGLLRHLVEEQDGQGKLVRQPGESREQAIDRAVAQAAEGSRAGCVFTAFSKVPVGRPVSNCMVGTVAQITDTVMQYYDAGVRRFILAGYDPRRYPAEFGATLLPALRAAMAAKGSRPSAAA
ncbi:MAG: LLM class flavin-dependent oxidoreductase [Rhodospirillaceae bacterium]|nr:LLM class flavin-dependent oxidoreductase [Rhodospirillaceae bacterium]